MRSHLYIRAACLVTGMGAFCSAGLAQTEIEGTLLGDTYSYFAVTDGGARDRAAVFAFEQAPPPAPQFFFNYYDGFLTAQWELEVPAPLDAGSLEVVSARVEVWNRKGAEWDPQGGEVRLFAAGFTGDNGFDEATWTEDTAYVGPTATTDGERDPYPRELGSGERAEDDPTAVAWAVGVPDSSYTGDPNSDPDEAFVIVFDLDVSNPVLQSELQQHLASGLSSWIIVSTFAAAQPPDTAYYPELITKEGVGNSGYGTTQEAPRLVLTVEEATSVRNWQLFQ